MGSILKVSELLATLLITERTVRLCIFRQSLESQRQYKRAFRLKKGSSGSSPNRSSFLSWQFTSRPYLFFPPAEFSSLLSFFHDYFDMLLLNAACWAGINLFTPALAQNYSACYSQSGKLHSEAQVCGSPLNPGACCNRIGGDVCTTAGLCYRQNTSPGHIYQDQCTDPSWGISCPFFCRKCTS